MPSIGFWWVSAGDEQTEENHIIDRQLLIYFREKDFIENSI